MKKIWSTFIRQKVHAVTINTKYQEGKRMQISTFIVFGLTSLTRIEIKPKSTVSKAYTIFRRSVERILDKLTMVLVLSGKL